MRSLLEENIVEASLRRTVPKTIEVADAAPPPRAAARVAAAEPASDKRSLAARTAVPAPGSAEPIKPIVVRTMSVRRMIAQATQQSPMAAAVPQRAGEGEGDMSETEEARTASALRPRQVASAGDAAIGLAARPAARASARGEWVIQVGALPTEAQAHDRLKEARTAAGAALARAEPFTERVTKGETTLFRARFAGFSKDGAAAACNRLKRNEIACLALKN
jgi:D-alanyl-D-alanine carboxypeptidase